MSDIETCKASVKCVLRTTLETGVPTFVLVVALVRILGLRAPKLPIFHEFVSQATVEAVEAEDKTKPASDPDADRLPTEQTRLLSPTAHQPKPKTWRQFLLGFIAILEIGLSTAILVLHAAGQVHTFQIVTCSISVASWVYAGLRPLLAPSCVPYYDLFTLYTAQFLAGCVVLCSNWRSVTYVLNVTMALIGIMAIVTMPLRVAGKPEPDAEGRHPALEDYCTLLEWMTFSWVSPMISIGANKALEERDVWQLSREMRTKVLMRQFLQLKRPSLLRRLLVANGRDMFLDMILTFACAVLDFAPPVFLNLILRALTPNSPSASPLSIIDSYATYAVDVATSGSRPISTRPLQPSYLFALAACVCQLLKSQAALQHLYFGRRASVRIKAELVASVYEKALRRKDVLGSVSKMGQDNEGADAGKIVSLIAADAEWVARFVTFGQFIYDAPVSAILACVLLYNLMGWVAFAGYIALILTLPINDYLVRRTNTLQKSVSAARDIRIRALNEAISSIKFIKFSAWESRWTSRVLAFREAELGWLWKLKITNFFMELVWAQGPVMVAAIGFSCFTLVAKRELGVEIAFSALRILEILSQSLGVLPITVASSIRTLVSIDRIDKYLNEDDVPDFVSSLKRDISPPHVGIDSRLGCANGRFRWPTSSAQLQPKKPAAPKKKSLWGRFLVLLRLRKPMPEVTIQEPQLEDEERPFELSDVSVLFPEGVLSVVFGPTGSGKSSLLAAILGEMDCLEGEVYLPKEPTRVDPKTGLRMGISYCAQRPWLEHKSIKDNMSASLIPVYQSPDNMLFHRLFGSPFEKERYEATIEACALRPDLLVFEDGDETEIGEKGVSLSGGQKARVALARAVYAHNKVVLLDDILSGKLSSSPIWNSSEFVGLLAVDSHTAEHLVSRCLLGPLMKHRTVVLITHHVDLVLPAAGWVVRIKEGRIEAQGVVETVRESGMLPVTSEKQVTSDEEPHGQENQKEADKKDEKKLARKLVEDEKKSTGSVTTQVYMTYLSAASYWLFALLVLLLALDQIIQLAQKFWFKHWSESYEPRTPGAHWYDFGFPSATQNVVPYLLVYIALQATVSLVSVLGQVPTIWSTLRASRTLYERMLRSVIRSPTRFFDTTPSGRILNRFSDMNSILICYTHTSNVADIDMIDGGLQSYMIQVLTQILALTISVATIAYAVPYFIIPAVIIAYLHVWFSNGYVTASRDLRRIESNTRSPIISGFGELINGIVTVRAFGLERDFLNNMYKRLDLSQAATHYYWMCNRWLLVRFDTLGAISILIATVGSIQAGASAGLTGIVVTQAQTFVQGLYWALRFWTELEQSLNSVERIQEYLDLPSEPPAIINSGRPPAAWPSATTGTLVVDNLVLKYALELEPVLNGVSFATKPSEKIGIVGRTGSGKSTLALALFRFVDPTAGKILLDGIATSDITTIGLDDLRSRLTLIPQDPVLFKGTIRDNLDPFNEYTDAECIQALQRVHLPSGNTPNLSTVASRAESIQDALLTSVVPGAEEQVQSQAEQEGVAAGTSKQALAAENPVSVTTRGNGTGITVFTLETNVSEGGNNFSQGQRQLLSMARALLRKSNIVVMDESTASVDFETDVKIQSTIREEFSQSILITIAHRLRTVIDNDRILVLSAGKVVEFDTPANLLKKEQGVFHEMCKKSGDYDQLLALVEAS
ncbi:ABC transporter [Ceratobasidium sp. AG-Ba]|nr:ABC transporter [Ceratobasidium sp. AG-Ba]